MPVLPWCNCYSRSRTRLSPIKTKALSGFWDDVIAPRFHIFGRASNFLDTRKSFSFIQEAGPVQAQACGGHRSRTQIDFQGCDLISTNAGRLGPPLRIASLKSERQPNANQPVEAACDQLLPLVGDRGLLVQQIAQIDDCRPLTR